jgi:uncharacterized protein (TIGR02145 family)
MAALWLLSCTTVERDNFYDSGGINYIGHDDIANYKPPVTIGKQVWMTENINYNVKGSKCYDNQESNCATYGRLYDWATAMALPASCNKNSCEISEKHRGICPEGWHIPSKAEWYELGRYVDGKDKYLKATNGWNNGNGEDKYGFSALPGGNGNSDGSFSGVGDIGNWWISNEFDGIFADRRIMSYNSDDVNYIVGSRKPDLYSVRCLQD